MTMRGKQKELEEELSTVNPAHNPDSCVYWDCEMSTCDLLFTQKSSLVLQQMSEIQILKEQLGNLGKSPQGNLGIQ